MKKEIVAKKYGRNLVVVIDGQKMTKVINTEDDKKVEESIKNKILLYNKKNNDSVKDQIIGLIDTTKQIKEKEVAEKKGIKKAIKKEVKKEKVVKKATKSNVNLIEELQSKELTKDDVTKLEELLAKTKKAQPNTVAITTNTPKRGEW